MFCCSVTWLRNGPKSPHYFGSFYSIMNLVLQDNFDISMFFACLFTFNTLKDWLSESKTEICQFLNVYCTLYWLLTQYWYLMTGTLCWSVTIWTERPQGGEGGVGQKWAQVDIGEGRQMPEFCGRLLALFSVGMDQSAPTTPHQHSPETTRRTVVQWVTVLRLLTPQSRFPLIFHRAQTRRAP